MGIVKNVQPTPSPLVNKPNKEAVETLNVNRPEDHVPQSVISYFGVSQGAVDMDMMKDISDWAYENTERASDALRKIKNLEMKLGTPSIGETRYNRMHRWIIIQKQREELKAQQDLLKNRR